MGKPDVAREHDQLAALNEEYRQAEERLQALYQEWERVAAETTKA
jgi:hypothetical protein